MTRSFITLDPAFGLQNGLSGTSTSKVAGTETRGLKNVLFSSASPRQPRMVRPLRRLRVASKGRPTQSPGRHPAPSPSLAPPLLAAAVPPSQERGERTK
mmetsp:Transcript_104266/g.334441  ORF Transcript_104266/g.334441 Transcript_104266/m.334441 type:complete len:99 (+) Transcript_104266:379-675(+)